MPNVAPGLRQNHRGVAPKVAAAAATCTSQAERLSLDAVSPSRPGTAGPRMRNITPACPCGSGEKASETCEGDIGKCCKGGCSFCIVRLSARTVALCTWCVEHHGETCPKHCWYCGGSFDRTWIPEGTTNFACRWCCEKQAVDMIPITFDMEGERHTLLADPSETMLSFLNAAPPKPLSKRLARIKLQWLGSGGRSIGGMPKWGIHWPTRWTLRDPGPCSATFRSADRRRVWIVVCSDHKAQDRNPKETVEAATLHERPSWKEDPGSLVPHVAGQPALPSRATGSLPLDPGSEGTPWEAVTIALRPPRCA